MHAQGCQLEGIAICGSLSSGLFFHSVPGPGVVDAYVNLDH